MDVIDRFEYATDKDPSRNYCLWEYTPPTPPEDKFRAINLLYQSFEHAGIDHRAYAVVDAIRDAIGSFQTVFGIKLIEGRLAWEFYFYDYRRRDRTVSISRVLDAIRPWMPCAVVASESLPYFMFSLDLNDDLVTGRSPLDVVHMYVGHPSNSVSTGIAYGVREGSTTLENFYFFFNAIRELPQVAAKVVSSAVFDETKIKLDRILVPELRHCQTICVANKQSHDCIYFSGIDVDQLLFFLDSLAYPEALISFVKGNRRDLDHLLFDVGFDYRYENGTLRILKSGYYNVF
jgi:hypothetical protein